MKRVILIVLILAFLGGGAFVWYRFFRSQEKVALSEAIDAIPESAVFLIEWKSLNAASQLDQENAVIAEIKQSQLLSDIFQNLKLVDSILKKDTATSSFLDKQPFLLSAHPSGVKKFNFLFTAAIPSHFSADKIGEVMRSGAQGSTVITRKYEETDVYELKQGESQILCYAMINSLILVSRSPVLVEEAIRHLRHGQSIRNNPGFRKIIEANKGRESGAIYINHRQLHSWASLFLQPDVARELKISGLFASVTGADIKVKNDALIISGFVFSNDTTNNYLNIFKGQKAQSIEFTDHLPANTAFCFWQGIQDLKSWQKNYYGWLENSNRLFSIQNSLTEFNRSRKTKFPEDLNAFAGNEFFCFIQEQNGEDTIPAEFIFAMKVNEPEKADTYFSSLTSSEDTSITREGELKIKPVMLGGLFNLTGLCPLPVKSNYCMRAGEYMYFSGNRESLRSVSKFINAGNIFSKSVAKKDMDEYLSNEASILTFSVPFRSRSFISKVFANSEGIESDLQRLFSSHSILALQITPGKELYYQDILIKHNPEAEKEQIPVWEIELAEEAVSVQSAGEGAEERIFVLTADNNIEVYSPDGTMLFTRALVSPLIGQIRALKAKTEGTLYLLIEETAIHLWNGNGTEVRGFPIKTPEPVRTGIAAFDYERTGDYRLIYEAEGRVRNFQLNGTKAKNWPENLQMALISKPVHLKAGAKDYLAFQESSSITITDRKGKLIRKYETGKMIAGVFNVIKGKKGDEILYCNADGKLYTLAPDREEMKAFPVTERFRSNLFVEHADLTNDRKRELVIADSLAVRIYNDSLGLVKKISFAGSRKMETKKAGDRTIPYLLSHADSALAFSEEGHILPGFPSHAKDISFSSGESASGYYLIRGRKILKFTLPR